MKKLATAALAALVVLALALAACTPGGQTSTTASTTASTASTTASTAAAAEAAELVMATNAEFPPFEFVNDANEYDGFDVVIARAIAGKLGMELRIDNMNFDSVLTAVETGKADVGIAALTVRADRLENADFTISYFKTTQVIIVPDGSDIAGPDDLPGKTVAVQEGTTGDLYCDEEVPDVEIVRFKKAPDTVLELKNGKVDAIVIDKDVANQFIGDNPDLKILPDDLTEEEYAMAVRKGNEELLGKLNGAIQDMFDSGEYDRIFNDFFS